jgi:putative addiction module component (TIGR02574 family)
MNLSTTLDDIRRLSVDERIRLAQAIWDTLDEDSVPAELTDGQKEGLSRRMQELDENPSIGLTWEQLMVRVRGDK